MNRREFLKAAGAGLAALALPQGGNAAEAAAVSRKPNILVILTDDVGWGDYRCGNPKGKIPSPHIDRLAREGMRFTNAHTPAALCAPTRYSMVTGNYPWRGRLPAGEWGFNCPSNLRPGQQAVGKLLQPAGYRSAMFGKQGFGGFYDLRGANGAPLPKGTLGPVEWGFEYSYLIPRGHQAMPHAFFENGRLASDPTRLGKNLEDADWDHSLVGERLLAKAVVFLDDHLAKNKAEGKHRPFFIHFCTDGAHSPYVPAPALAGTPLKDATKMTAHTDMVYETDILTGQLVGALEQRGLLADTLIVVTSDNGGLPFERSFGHDAVGGLRGRKAYIFEGGHRVPFIARWGDGTPDGSRIPPGTVRGQVIGTHDIVATALDLAGVKPPPDQVLDAVSLAPVLLGRRDDSQPVRQALLVQSSPGRDAFDDGGFSTADDELTAQEAQKKAGDKGAMKGKARSRGMAHAVIEGDWKLVVDSADKPAALYNMVADLAEQKNVIADTSQSERLKRMTQIYREIRQSARSTPPVGA